MPNLQSVKQRYGIIGRSPALERALETALQVAATDLTVLITGESGVGKENISRIIHDYSNRKHNPFIAINCGAIPAGTINSELFGHEKGAFTGASGERKGYFETYDTGTIFLDEIGEMPSDTQAYLLRILENGEYIRVGSSKVLKTDVRIIAATNKDLMERVKQGKFREDLYYRLNTVPIQMPPLRERREDIYMLFRKFVVDFAEQYNSSPIQLDDRAQLILENYNWPGNIRELKNVAEQLSVLTEERIITAEFMLEVLPHLLQRNLPARQEDLQSNASGMQERDILYQLLFDMKNDMKELKALVFRIIQENDLRVPSIPGVQSLQAAAFESAPPTDVLAIAEEPVPVSMPIILDSNGRQAYHDSETVDENLSLQENEKNLINKALKKHNGRRKEAAQDLGISERTLYRKIKEYELQL